MVSDTRTSYYATGPEPRFLKFETLTCCHIDTSAVIPELLGPEALAWLNAYNEHVYNTLAPLLPEDVAQWLRSRTLPL